MLPFIRFRSSSFGCPKTNLTSSGNDSSASTGIFQKISVIIMRSNDRQTIVESGSDANEDKMMFGFGMQNG